MTLEAQLQQMIRTLTKGTTEQIHNLMALSMALLADIQRLNNRSAFEVHNPHVGHYRLGIALPVHFALQDILNLDRPAQRCSVEHIGADQDLDALKIQEASHTRHCIRHSHAVGAHGGTAWLWHRDQYCVRSRTPF